MNERREGILEWAVKWGIIIVIGTAVIPLIPGFLVLGYFCLTITIWFFEKDGFLIKLGKILAGGIIYAILIIGVVKVEDLIAIEFYKIENQKLVATYHELRDPMWLFRNIRNYSTPLLIMLLWEKLMIIPIPRVSRFFQNRGRKRNTRLIIGKKEDGSELELTWRDINHHIHILGQSGAGKSVLLRNFYKYLIYNNYGVIQFDFKGDIEVLRDFERYCSESGRELKILSLSKNFGFSYNPLSNGNASEIKDKVVNALEWSEPYYKKIAEEVLLKLLEALVELRDHQGSHISLRSVYTLLSSPNEVINLSQKISSKSLKVYLIEFSKNLRDGKLKAETSGLRADIGVMLGADTGFFFEGGRSLKFLKEMKEGSVLLIQLDTQKYPVQGLRAAKMLLSEIRGCSGEIASNIALNERPRVAVLIDEFADVINDYESAKLYSGFLNRARGSGIGNIIAHQSLGDFSDPRVKSQILDNTETIFSFVQKDPETAEVLAKICGTIASVIKTMRIRKGHFYDLEEGQGSKKDVEKYLVHPNIYKNLSIGEAVYIAKKPSRCGKILVSCNL